MLAAIVISPLVGALILGLAGKRLGERAIGWLACSTVGVSMAISFHAFFGELLPRMKAGENTPITEYLFTWIEVGSFRADAALLLDPLSGIYILFITFVGFWIHVFAIGYMRGDGGYRRFFAYLNLFMFAMLTLVLADNFLLMFVGWEGVGLCSYLLIGHYFLKDFANDAAKKAFIVNRVGDFGFALGILLLFYKAGTIAYFTDVERGVRGAFDWAAAQAVDPLAASTVFAGGMTTIAVLLFIGATGKSAQIPLFVWLPDAMAGPTPVSALIHAATMVTAGVYMVARSGSIYAHAPTAMLIVAVVGAATALFAATIAVAQWDIKKVLAYSTISQLGYMFLACGVGAFGAGVFHVFTHAFFKALLFLGSGSIIIALHHEQDMRSMGGLKKHLPVTFRTMAVGWLAIAGAPLLSGFFSKDEILFKTFTSPRIPVVLWAAGAVTALLTAVYMTRLMILTFWNDERFDLKHGPPPRESPLSMRIPLVVLAVGAALSGWLGVSEGLSGGRIPNVIEHLLEPAVAHVTSPHSADRGVEWILTGVSSLIAIGGILLGFSWFKSRPLRKAPRLLEEKYRVDEIYDAALVRPVEWLSDRVLWRFFDVRIIDGAVNAAGRIAAVTGSGMRYLQSGLVRGYVAVVVLGALLLIGYFVIR